MVLKQGLRVQLVTPLPRLLKGRERIITTVFGGRSIATRNRQVAKLMDLGFKKAPTNVSLGNHTCQTTHRLT